MKRLIIAVLLMLAFVSLAIAGTIKPSGMSQKDLYNLLSKMVTMQNELKADHNVLAAQVLAGSINANYSSASKRPLTTSTDLSLTQ